jgi:hypothetical protein
VSEVLEQLELAICPLAKHGGGEGLHDLLDGDGSARELVLGRAEGVSTGYLYGDAAWEEASGPIEGNDGGASPVLGVAEGSVLTRPDQRRPFRRAVGRHTAWLPQRPGRISWHVQCGAVAIKIGREGEDEVLEDSLCQRWRA